MHISLQFDDFFWKKFQSSNFTHIWDFNKNFSSKTCWDTLYFKIPRNRPSNFISNFTAWDQSDKFVKIYITGLSKGVNELAKDAFEFVVGESSLHFKISAFQGKNIIFNIKETPYKISAESSSFKAKSDMVAILLAKAEKGVKWTHLKKSDQIADNKPKLVLF